MKNEIKKALKVLNSRYTKIVANHDNTFTVTVGAKTETLTEREFLHDYRRYLKYIKSERDDFEENHLFVEKEKAKIAASE